MTAGEAIAWSAAKAAAVAGLSLPVLMAARGPAARRGDLGGGSTPRLAAGPRAALLVVPAVLPALLCGYAYRPEALDWVNAKWRVDLLHAGLCWARFLPWGWLAAAVVGGADVARGRLAWRQTRRRRSAAAHALGRWRLWRAANAGPLCGAALAGVLTLGESEIAGLLQARGWPEWALRRIAGGVPWPEIAAALWPAVGLLLAGVAAAVVSARNGGRGTGERRSRWPLGGWLLVAWTLSVLLPVGRVAGGVADGWPAMLAQPNFAWELLRSGLIAAVAAAAAWFAANWRWSVVLLPVGLAGPLMLSVWAQSLFGGTRVAHTPLPHLFALTLLVLPAAWLLRRSLPRLEGRGVRVAGQLSRHGCDAVRRRAAWRVWRRAGGPRAAAWGLVFLTAFWDLLVGSTLHAAGWGTVPGRLYNLAHYGQSDALAAMVAAAGAASLLVPAAAVAASAARR